jgi:purine-binding chemotaxis protein CheW
MVKSEKLLVFWLNNKRFALYLNQVERTIHIVEFYCLPKPAEYIAGIINFHGEFVPVINTRSIFNMQQREAELSDQLIIVHVLEQRFALWVDSTDEIIDYKAREHQPDNNILSADHINSLINVNNNMVLLFDFTKFLESYKINLVDIMVNAEEALINDKSFMKKESPQLAKSKKTRKKRVIKSAVIT